MKHLLQVMTLLFTVAAVPVYADEYTDAINKFRQSPTTQPFFEKSYGYAIFPTIGKGGVGVGGAYGKGRVYTKAGMRTGDVSMTQLSVGFQLGGQTFSQLIFFENKEAYDKFTSGNFEFGAQASAVAIAVGAGAQAGTGGTQANIDKSQMENHYIDGMAVFSMQKGGLMYEASLGGQKFKFTPVGNKQKGGHE